MLAERQNDKGFSSQAITILESMSDAFFALDNQWNFSYVNSQAEKLLCRAREELLGRRLFDAFPDAVDSIFHKHYVRAMETREPNQFEAYYEPLDGWFEVRVHPNPNGLGIYFNNINERKAAEEMRAQLMRQLEESNALFQTLLNRAPIGIGFWDKDLRYAHVNEALAEMNGVPAPQHLGKTINEVLPQMGPEVGETFRTVLRERKPLLNQEVSGETPAAPGVVRYWNVSYYPVQTEDALLGVGAICEEITESKRQEASRLALLAQLQREQETIKESEESFRLLADSIPQIVWTTDPQGSVTYFNQRWYDYTGLTPSDSLDWEWQRVIHPDDLGRCLDSWLLALRTGEAYEVEYRFVRADSKEEWHLGRAHPVRNEAGVIVQWCGTSTNIDEQKRMEERRDAFLSIASHELKTPLTSIKGYVQLLERLMEAGEYEKMSPYLTKSSRYIDRLTNLIADLLDISSIEAGKLQMHAASFDFDALLASCIETGQTTTARHEIVQVSNEDTFQVEGDRRRLEQVLTNLLSNAIKYSPEASRVEVSLHKQGEHLHVAVRDFGIGIAPHEQQRIFDRFYRTEDAAARFSGLGIGLYVSNEIVKQHGGKMWVESKPHEGSTFHFTIPLRAA